MGLMEKFDFLRNSSNNAEALKLQYKANNDFIRVIMDKNSQEKIEYNPYLIKNIIENYDYPSELKPLALKLGEYIGIENLSLCAYNLQSIRTDRNKKFKIGIFDLIRLQNVRASYWAEKNLIEYYYLTDLPHEFLHMASANNLKALEDIFYCGFSYDVGDLSFCNGLNEGYTELLTRRIFFNDDYDGMIAYKENFYLLKMFELLYDDYRDMEKDFFKANYRGPINNFLKYGSMDEFFEFTTYLDYLAFTPNIKCEEQKAFKLIKDVIRRTDNQKYNLALEIENEYYESEYEEYDEKTYSFGEKHH